MGFPMALAMQAARKPAMKGRKAKTVGGLTKATLVKSKSGKIVSKDASARAKKNWAGSALKKWGDACKQARKALGIKGFCAVGGKSAQGKALYAKAKAILGKWSSAAAACVDGPRRQHIVFREHLRPGVHAAMPSEHF